MIVLVSNDDREISFNEHDTVTVKLFGEHWRKLLIAGMEAVQIVSFLAKSSRYDAAQNVWTVCNGFYFERIAEQFGGAFRKAFGANVRIVKAAPEEPGLKFPHRGDKGKIYIFFDGLSADEVRNGTAQQSKIFA